MYTRKMKDKKNKQEMIHCLNENFPDLSFWNRLGEFHHKTPLLYQSGNKISGNHMIICSFTKYNTTLSLRKPLTLTSQVMHI